MDWAASACRPTRRKGCQQTTRPSHPVTVRVARSVNTYPGQVSKWRLSKRGTEIVFISTMDFLESPGEALKGLEAPCLWSVHRQSSRRAGQSFCEGRVAASPGSGGLESLESVQTPRPSQTRPKKHCGFQWSWVRG